MKIVSVNGLFGSMAGTYIRQVLTTDKWSDKTKKTPVIFDVEPLESFLKFGDIKTVIANPHMLKAYFEAANYNTILDLESQMNDLNDEYDLNILDYNFRAFDFNEHAFLEYMKAYHRYSFPDNPELIPISKHSFLKNALYALYYYHSRRHSYDCKAHMTDMESWLDNYLERCANLQRTYFTNSVFVKRYVQDTHRQLTKEVMNGISNAQTHFKSFLIDEFGYIDLKVIEPNRDKNKMLRSIDRAVKYG